MITSVKMANWRVYAEHEIYFQPGLNFLMGANGVGKTSVLEAIAYALTGEPSTVKERGKLLRDPEKVATVRLTIRIEQHEYLVERSQSYKRAESAQLTRIGEHKVLASGQGRVTAKIQELMGVSADFLQRIIYMAEGDVFRFLDQPPGEAIDAQIRQVLGLTQMDEFLQAMELAGKELKAQIKTVQSLLADLEKAKVRDEAEFVHELQEMDIRRDTVLINLGEIQKRINDLKRDQESVLRLKPLLFDAVKDLRQDVNLWSNIEALSVVEFFAQLERQSQEAEAQVKDWDIAQAHLQGEQSASQRILDLLSPYAGRADTLPCPVCSKPMTGMEREAIIQTIQGDIQRLEAEIQNLQKRRLEAEQALSHVKRYLTAVRELRNALVHGSFQNINAAMAFERLIQAVDTQSAESLAQLEQLDQEATDYNQKIAELETEKAEYMTLKNRLNSQGYLSPKEASEALVGMETRSLSIRAAQSAAQETLAVQRNADLRSIYDQAAQAWAMFLGNDRWQIELDAAGMPLMRDKDGREFDLSQFSGGEKTALLIMLHTVIAHHFSKSDFLLVDEPLEHLDPINRRSLIHFLVNAYRQGAFQQGIVATFEESLIRKYLSEEGVAAIYL